MRRWGIVAGVMLGVAGWLMAASPASARKIVVGQPAPDFRLRLSGGDKVALSDLKGQVVVINLWATWCGPCKQEMPGLDLMQVNGAKYGLRVFGVLAMDQTSLFQLRPLAKVLHYPLGTMSGDYIPIGNAVPTNYIIDRAGIVRYARATALTPKEYAEILTPLLAEPAPAVAIAEQSK